MESAKTSLEIVCATFESDFLCLLPLFLAMRLLFPVLFFN